MLGICRLLDPEETGRNENLTLERLVNSINPSTFWTLRSELDGALKKAMDSSKFVRAHRNRKLAHNDLRTIQEIHAEHLPGVSRAAIEKSLDSIRDVMNKVSVHFLETTVFYQEFIFGPGDVQSLLRRLENAEVYRQEKSRRVMPP
jgi:arginyl-tRNA synthetase